MGRLDETAEPELLESVLAPADTVFSRLLFFKERLLEQTNTWRKTYGAFIISRAVQKITDALDEVDDADANQLLHTRTRLLRTISDGYASVDFYSRKRSTAEKQYADELVKLLREIERFVDTLEEKVLAQRP